MGGIVCIVEFLLEVRFLENTSCVISFNNNNNKRISKTKPFDEIKGVVIADYQNYLEDEWMKELKAKYPIKVNKKELTFLSIR